MPRRALLTLDRIVRSSAPAQALALAVLVLVALVLPVRAHAKTILAPDLCHAESPVPAPAATRARAFTCSREPAAGYQNGTLWLRIPASAIPPSARHEPSLLVHYSRFDRLDVTFTYADGRKVVRSVRNGAFGHAWRIGGQLLFDPPARDAPLSAITLQFTRLASIDMLRIRVLDRGTAAIQSTALGLCIGAALMLLLVGTVYNASLAGSLRRQYPLWQAGWAGAMLAWGAIWAQAHLLIAPRLAGTFSAQTCSAIACLAITFAAFSAITAPGEAATPRLARRIVLTMATACSLLGIPTAFLRSGPVDAAAAMIGFLLIATMLGVAVCLVWAWRRGSQEARDFATAWALPIVILSSADMIGSNVGLWGAGPQLLVVLAAAWQTLWLAAAASRLHARLHLEHAQAQRGEAQARELARRDVLTGLRNRRGFTEDIEPALAAVNAGEGKAALLLLDVDHFKRVNDRHGHDAGDSVLQSVARVIATFEAADCVPARLGGEEFALLIHGERAATAPAIAEALRRAIAAYPHGDIIAHQPVTVSIGLSRARAGRAFRDLYRDADQALYQAKHAGRDRVVPFASENSPAKEAPVPA
ncbi:GGDEF domain-containing protein [Novosphingobium sp. 1949]|uniref:diguanylate cyclase n=1 Tax=Novosphingobium organovorum TaxID=2930092 RepID=A0ABT0BE20_9SPHN|nr:GGDEF domain-containing protein [Novosphingobium organovorum]MCJ2183233.1 GGDEF domain-containing protein [Novosphingobium organovorum]